MYTVYILQSKLNGRFYIGHTSNIKKRLLEHNSGLTYSTRNYIPWDLVYKKDFNSKGFAQHIELKIKRMKSRKFIEKLINDEIEDYFFYKP
jgi:putative endonuclease